MSLPKEKKPRNVKDPQKKARTMLGTVFERLAEDIKRAPPGSIAGIKASELLCKLANVDKMTVAASQERIPVVFTKIEMTKDDKIQPMQEQGKPLDWATIPQFEDHTPPDEPIKPLTENK